MRATMMTSMVAVAAMALGQGAAGQSRESGSAGPRSVLPRDREIALARSAAPAAVSAEATVLTWNGHDFEVGVEGTNGVTCYVGRSWVESLEPHCFDEEGARTILPIHLLETRLLHEGRNSEEIDAAVAEGLRSGSLRLPTRPVMSYMMSAGQQLVSDDGRSVGAWESHLMIYYPYLTEEDLGLGPTPSTDAAVVVDPGTPFSNIMIVLKAHVPVTEAGASSR